MSTAALPVASHQKRLDELAEAISCEHNHTALFVAKSLGHAIKCGDALIEAKELCGHGNWLYWLRANVDMSESSARTYMRIAWNADTLLQEDITSIGAAQQLLSRSGLRLQITDRQKSEIIDLAERGVPQVRIAERVGVSQASVSRHIADPQRGTRPRPTKNLDANRSRRRSMPISQAMIERTAAWLCKRLGGYGYPERPTDAVRRDAGDLLRHVLEAA